MTALDPRTHARTTDPDTSHEAAARLGPAGTMMAALLGAFLDADLTCEQAALSCGYEPERASKRVSDLANVEWITDTGERRVGRTGRRQIVWHITDNGVLALARYLTP